MTLPRWVLDRILALPATFTGSFTVNCFQGGVSAVEVKMFHKAETEERMTPTAH